MLPKAKKLLNMDRVHLASEISSFGLNTLAIITGNIPVALLAQAPSVIEKCLASTNCFKQELSDLLKNQLTDVIEKTIKSCEKKMCNHVISEFFLILEPRVQSSSNFDFTIEEVQDWIFKQIKTEARWEGLYLTPNDIAFLYSFFMDSFIEELTKHTELCNNIEIKTLISLTGTIQEHEKRLSDLEEQLLNIHLHVNRNNDYIFTIPNDVSLDCTFVGRQNDINNIKELISKNKLLLLSGMAGIGKTQILKQLFQTYLQDYIAERSNEFEGLGYMIYSGSIDNTVYSSMNYLRTGNYEYDLKIAWEKLYEIGRKYKCFLMIDNFNTSIKTDKSFHKLFSFNGKILITSRRHNYTRFYEYCLGPLDDKSCFDLFKNIYKVEDANYEILKFILLELAAKHTQTIELLARLANDNCWTLMQLKERLLEKKFNLCFMSEDDDIISIQTEYEKLFNLASLNESDINVLQAFSMFSNRNINIETCYMLLHEDAGFDSILFFESLFRKGWLEKKGDNLYMHPVIAEVMLGWKLPSIDRHKYLIEKLIDEVGVDDCLKLNKAVPLIEIADSVCCIFDSGYSDNIFNLAYVVCDTYIFLYRFNEAEHMINIMTSLQKKSGKEDSINMAYIYIKTAYLKDRCGKYSEALDYAKKAREYYDEGSIDDIKIKHFIALQNFMLGDYLEAIDCFSYIIEKISNLSECTLNIHLEKIYLINALLRVKRDKEALILANEVLPCLESISPEHSRANAYDLIANVYLSCDYLKALELKKQSLSLHEKIYGEYSIDVAYIYMGMGSIYHYLENYIKSEKHYIKCEEIFLTKLDSWHPIIGQLFYEIGNLYIDMQKPKQAVNYLEKAVANGEKNLDRDNEMLSLYYSELGFAHCANGNAQQAEIFLKKGRFKAKYNPKLQAIEVTK